MAEAVLRNGRPLPKIVRSGGEAGRAWASFEGERRMVGAELNYTTDSGPWPERMWKTLPAVLDEGARTVHAQVPDGSTAFYLNLTDDTGCVVSTEHEEAGEHRVPTGEIPVVLELSRHVHGAEPLRGSGRNGEAVPLPERSVS
jgi:hypothetical protein